MAARHGIDWYVCRSGHRVGPMTDVELALLANLRQLRESDYIWCQGLPDWVAAASLPGFLPPSAAALPAPRAPAIADDRRPRSISLTDRYRSTLAAPRPIAAMDGDGVDLRSTAPVAPSTAPPRDISAGPPRPVDLPPSWSAPTVEHRAMPSALAAFCASLPEEPMSPPTPAMTSALVPIEQPDSLPAGLATLLSRPNRRIIATALVSALEQRGVRTIHDLAHNELLKSVAAFAIDEIPLPLRFPLVKAIGRERLETTLVCALILVRERLLPDAAVKDIVFSVLDSDVLDQRIKAVLAIQSTVLAAYDALPSRTQVTEGVSSLLAGMKSRVQTAASGLGGMIAPPPTPSPRSDASAT